MEYKLIKNYNDCKIMSSFYNKSTNKYLNFKKRGPKQIEKMSKLDNWFGYIVEDKKVPVGIFNIRLQVNKALFGMVVGFEFQGKGYGNKIMKMIERESKFLGAKVMELHVFEKNEKAINLYKKNKYKIKHKDIVMEKKL